MDMEKKKIVILVEILAILIVILFVGSAQVVTPFFGDINFIDEGQFGAWAAHMLFGKLMYKDIYIPYGPLYVYPLYILFKIFGASAFLTRLYLSLCSFAGALIINFMLARLVIKRVIRLLTVFLVIALGATQVRYALGLLCVYCLLRATQQKTWKSFVVLGMLLAATFLFSPEIGIFSLAAALSYFTFGLMKGPITSTAKYTLLTIAGTLAVAVSFTVWSHHEGWFIDYLKTTLDALLSFSGIGLPNGQNFPNALTFLPNLLSQQMFLYWTIFFYIVCLFYIFTRCVTNSLNKQDALAFGVTLYGILLYTILIGRSGHYFGIIAPMLILAAFFVTKLISLRQSGRDKVFATLIIILLCLFSVRLLSVFRPNFNRLTQLPNAFFSKKNNPALVGPITISQAQESHIKSLQSFISKNTNKKDNIFFFDNEPMFYLLTNRPNPTRYDLPYLANSYMMRLEIIRSLQKDAPKYIFFDPSAWSVDGVPNTQRLPEVAEFIKKNYHSVAEADKVIVYRHNE